MANRDFVALVHQDRVLLDPAGQLPCLVLEKGYPSYADLLALVGADRFIAPSVKLGPDRYVHTVAVKGVVPSGTWVPLADLPGDTDVAATVVRSALEFVGQAPSRRAAWFRPGWLEHAEAWVDEALARSGRTRTGATWVARMWCLSAVLRIPTDLGHAWFKATCEYFHSEAAITRVLAEHFPDLVPVVIAEDDDLAWLLMESLPGASSDERAPDAALALAPVFSEVQIASVDLRDELSAAGCPDHGLAHTLTGFRGVLAESLELASLSNEELAAAHGVGDEVEELLEEFWACGLPDTLSHGDLHLGNVAYDGSQLRVFDWTDACLSHPFLDGGHLARFNAESTDEHSSPDPSLAAAFADRWRTEYPEADIDRALALAPLVNLVFQTVSYEGILRGVEERSHWEVGGVVARTLRQLPAKVAALRQVR